MVSDGDEAATRRVAVEIDGSGVRVGDPPDWNLVTVMLMAAMAWLKAVANPSIEEDDPDGSVTVSVTLTGDGSPMTVTRCPGDASDVVVVSHLALGLSYSIAERRPSSVEA